MLTATPAQCREKASECLQKAEHIANSAQKAALLRYAEWWTRLGDL